MNKPKTIGEIIADARLKSGLSLRTVAARISINFSYLSEIEKGRRNPSEKVVRGLSEQPELGLDFDFLMAHSNRIGEEAEDYLKDHPLFGTVIRNVARKKMSDEQLQKLNKTIDKMKE